MLSIHHTGKNLKTFALLCDLLLKPPVSRTAVHSSLPHCRKYSRWFFYSSVPDSSQTARESKQETRERERERERETPCSPLSMSPPSFWPKDERCPPRPRPQRQSKPEPLPRQQRCTHVRPNIHRHARRRISSVRPLAEAPAAFRASIQSHPSPAIGAKYARQQKRESHRPTAREGIGEEDVVRDKGEDRRPPEPELGDVYLLLYGDAKTDDRLRHDGTSCFYCCKSRDENAFGGFQGTI